MSGIISTAENAIREQVGTVAALAEATADVPYYKFNGLWTRQVQDLVCQSPMDIAFFFSL